MLPFRILVLGGGGTKGFLHIGALTELENRVKNLTTHFHKGIYGCSIGSVLATGIAFGMNATQMEKLSRKCMNLGFLFDSLSLSSLKDSVAKKGVFEMDTFETHILEAFREEGIDLKGKCLQDAKIPLYVLASNLTKGVPTIFQKNVPIMSALRASCCIPFLFRPQTIGKSVYVDGGLMTNVILKLIPDENQAETLTLCIIHANPHVTPTNIEKMPPLEYMYKLYKNVALYEHYQFKHANIVNLYYPGGSGVSDPSEEDKEDMIVTGKCLMRGFLTKRSC
jgi:predicted acylesterase/phospholipase RssA